MKNWFNFILITTAVILCLGVWWFIMGDPSGFLDGVKRHEPDPENLLAVIHTGGPIVGLLLAFIFLGIAYSIERMLSLGKAQGKGDPQKFISSVVDDLANGNFDQALVSCDTQRGSLANVLRSAISRFKEIENDDEFPAEKKLSEVQRSIDESMNLETPLLEKNLVIISTIASISVLFGLLGTTIGMVRAFRALASSGTVSATQLSLGISEALYNTAGGLIGAIIAIMSYNYLTTKVDSFVYMIDEAILSVTQIFTGRIKK